MNPFQTYQTYLALKRHFSSSYDFHKYNGKTNVSINSFEKRPDKYKFVKLSRHTDPLNYLLANILHDNNFWIGSPDSDSTYTAWRKRIESLSYHFKNELAQLDDRFNETFGAPNKFLNLLVNNKISLETFTILIDLLGLEEYYKDSQDPLLKEKLVLARKYRPFLKYDLGKFEKLLVERFRENGDAIS